MGGPGCDEWIDCSPWNPDTQARVIRNIPGTWRFPGVLHSPISVVGDHDVARSPLYHLTVALASLQVRRDRRDRHERERPGLVYDGLATNLCYTPEDVPGVATATVPEVDRCLLRRYLAGAATPADARARGAITRSSLADTDRFSGTRTVLDDAHTGSVRLIDPPSALWAGTTTPHVVEVHNDGPERWDAGLQPPIHLACHWLAPDGRIVVRDGGRTALSASIGAGQARHLRMAVPAPTEPGRYLLQPALVHEGVRWFAEGEPTPVTVRPGPAPLVATGAGELPAAVSPGASRSRS